MSLAMWLELRRKLITFSELMKVSSASVWGVGLCLGILNQGSNDWSAMPEPNYSKARLVSAMRKNNDLLRKFTVLSRSRACQSAVGTPAPIRPGLQATLSSRASSRGRTQLPAQVIKIERGFIPRMPQKSMSRNLKLYSGLLKKLARDCDDPGRRNDLVDQLFFSTATRKSLRYEFEL
jgi:hypothetical protein